MTDVGRWLLITGIVIAIVGGVFMLTGRATLPGDLVIRRGNLTVFAPLATGLLISVVLTIVLNLLLRAR